MPSLLYNKKLPGLCQPAFFMVLLALVSGFSVFFGSDLHAQGNLLITPRRAVFEGSQRSLDLNLANTGSDTATYAISVIQIRMTDEGSFETITEPDPDQRFAERYIRYFPRTVTLGPNEAQVVKVQVLNYNQLQPGEYRSHFYFRAVPDATPLGDVDAARDDTGISVVLTPVFGITIPVIIRVGTSNTAVTLTDLSYDMVDGTTPRLSMVFRRTGNMSVYGDLAIDHISPQGTITRVGIANGLAIYTPNALRKFQMNLNPAQGVDFAAGKLRVTFSASSDVKPEKYAEAELVLR
jgi:hypothetical protein